MPNDTRKLTKLGPLWYRQAEDFYSLLLQNCFQSLVRAEAEMLLCTLLHRRYRSSSLAHSHLLPVERLARDLHSFPDPGALERGKGCLSTLHALILCSVVALEGSQPKGIGLA